MNNAPEVANRGFLRPPFVYLLATVAGIVLHVLSPVPLVSRAAGALIGSSFIVMGVALFVYATRTLSAAGTPVPGNRPTVAVVCSGPYCLSRNPIYLAFSTVQLGLAYFLNSPWLLASLVFAILVMSLVVIPREERYLEAHFAAEYLPYKASTRRWF